MFDVMVNPEPAVSDIFGSEGWRTVCATPKVRAAMTSATRPALAISLNLFNAFTDSLSSTQLPPDFTVMAKPTEGPQVPPSPAVSRWPHPAIRPGHGKVHGPAFRPSAVTSVRRVGERDRLARASVLNTEVVER